MQPWTVRYVIRATVAGALAMLAAAGTIWVDNPYVKVASAGALVLGGYLGVGALSPQMEPFVAVTNNDAPVPVKSPPAVAVPDE